MAKRKAHSLTGRITLDLMVQAFKTVKRNRGAAGIDKVSVTMFDANRDDNLLALMRDLKQGCYQPHPLRRAYIHKARGKLRPLGIPAVRDRVAQEVVRCLLSPIFERLFHPASYGFRPRRNCHQAVAHVLWLCRHGYSVVLDADIRGFFDQIPHHVVMAAVAAEVADGNILRLVERFLKSGVMEDGVFKPTSIGTPQGGVISPLLANIVLNHLDWRLHEAGYRFVRYADDFVVPCPSHAQAKEARALVERTLADLGLELNQDKTTVVHFGRGFLFLGFRLSSRAVTVRPTSVEKFKTKVKGLTVRKHNLDAQVVEKLNRVIRGTAHYFAAPFSDCQWQFRNLDAFVRRRLRSMKFKRISRPDNFRMRDRHFRRLGLLSLLDFCSP
jgi:RNA-directed DNA polymerase